MRSARVFEVKSGFSWEISLLPRTNAISGDLSPQHGRKSGFLIFCWRFPARRYFSGLITHFQTHKHIGLTSVALDQSFRSEIRDFQGKYHFCLLHGRFWSISVH